MVGGRENGKVGVLIRAVTHDVQIATTFRFNGGHYACYPCILTQVDAGKK